MRSPADHPTHRCNGFNFCSWCGRKLREVLCLQCLNGYVSRSALITDNHEPRCFEHAVTADLASLPAAEPVPKPAPEPVTES